MICVLLYDGSTQRLTESGFMWFYGFVLFYGEAGNRTCDPWFTRHSAKPLHHGGFSTESGFMLLVVLCPGTIPRRLH